MNQARFLLPALLTVLALPAYGAMTRDQIIAKQMDCISNSQESTSIDWNDVCYMNAPDDRLAMVNNALDQVEQYQQESPQQVQHVYEANPVIVKSTDDTAYKSLDDIDINKRQRLDPRHTHSVEVGIEPYAYQYEEPDIGVKSKGALVSYYANYMFRPEDSNVLNNTIFNMYGIEGRFAAGKEDYSGSGEDKGIKDFSYEIRGLVGKEYRLVDNTMIDLYLGAGYRYKEDQSGGRLTTTGFYGYDRHSNYFYIPVGLHANRGFGVWTIGGNLEYDFFINGMQISDFSDGKQFTGYDNPNVHNRQTGGFGVRGGLKFAYNTPRLSFFIEPFIRLWNIDESQVKVASVDGAVREWVEPHNTTTEIGSKIGLLF